MAGKKAKAASQQASQVEDVLRALQKVPADVQGAKQRLQALLKDNQQNFLVHRLLARVLYHEASAAEGGEARLSKLKQALLHASQAQTLNPQSLSSSALRATIAINTLVEESSGPAPANAAAFRTELQSAISAATAAVGASAEQIQEPVITINDGRTQTCDPCSLRVQDQIQAWVREGRWDRVAQERACVLSCMQQVLQSCHTLLDSTSIPVDGVVRLLQHILRSLLPHRPMQQDLQAWASQLLGKGVSLDDVQKKLETQTAVGELLKLLRPAGASGALPDAQMLLQAQQTLLQQSQALQQQLAAMQTQHQAPSHGSSQPQVTAQAQQLEQAQQAQHASTTGPQVQFRASPAAQPQPPQQASQQPPATLQQQRRRPRNCPTLQPKSTAPAATQHQQQQPMHLQTSASQALVPTHQQQQQQQQQALVSTQSLPAQQQQQHPPVVQLAEEREWDWDKEPPATGVASNTAQHPTAATSAAMRRRARSKAAGRGNQAPPRTGRDRTRQERYTEVEAYWRSLRPEQRQELLRVPLAALLQGVRAELGQEAVEEACEAIILLHEQNNQSARYWSCPTCDQKFNSGREYLAHIELAHEELAVQGGKYVVCGKCQVEVVGMYYTSTCVADYSLCARCFHQELLSGSDVVTAYERIYPRVPAVGGPQQWSETGSDFVSTRDSFTSMEELEEYSRNTNARGSPLPLQGSSEWASPVDPAAAASGSRGRPNSKSPARTAKHSAGMMMAAGVPSQGGAGAWRAAPVDGSSTRHRHKRSHSSGSSSQASSTEAGGPPLVRQHSSPAGALPQVAAASQGGAHAAQRPGKEAGRAAGDATGASSHQHQGPAPGSSAEDGSLDAGSGLLKSWWPRRLLQSWGADKKTLQRPGTAGSAEQQPGAAPAAAVTAPDAGGGSSRQPAGGKQQPVGPGGGAGQGEGAGEPRGSDASSEAHSSSWSSGEHHTPGAPDDQQKQQQQHHDSQQAGSGSDARLQGGSGGEGTGTARAGPPASAHPSNPHARAPRLPASAEARTLAAVADEIMQKLRETYSADHGRGDSALGSVMQFVYRVLRVMAEGAAEPGTGKAVSASAAAALLSSPGVQDFLNQPAVVYHQPEILRAVLGVLPFRDLQMVLAYVVREHADAASGVHRRGQRRRRAASEGSAEDAERSEAGSEGDEGSMGDDDEVYDDEDEDEDEDDLVDEDEEGDEGDEDLGYGEDDEEEAEEVEEEEEIVGEDDDLRGQAGYEAAMRGYRSARTQGAGGQGQGSGPARRRRGPRPQDGNSLQAASQGRVGHVARHGRRAQRHPHQRADMVPYQGDSDGECDDGLGLEPLGPPPLFCLHVPDISSLHSLVADVWNREGESVDGGPGEGGHTSTTSRAHHTSSPEARSRQNTSGGNNTGTKGDLGDIADLLMMTALQAEGGLRPGALAATGKDSGTTTALATQRPDPQPWLSPAPWWLDHLMTSLPAPAPPQPPNAPPSGNIARASSTPAPPPDPATAGALCALKWVYGKVVSTHSEEFRARQAELRGGRERDVAVLELYDELSTHWRYLQGTLDSKGRLEELRKEARAQFQLVKQIEDEGRHCNASEAAEFLGVLTASHEAAAASAAANHQGDAPLGIPRLNLCEAAVDVVRRHPALAGEPSQRYARALLDRELAALLLVEAMLAHEGDEAGRARSAAEEALRKLRAEVRDVEGEYTRLETEGPASHRRKDLLDKATKEAEHRERLQDLQNRLISLTERIAAEEAARQKWNDKLTEADRDLGLVREELRRHSLRRKQLDEICAQLEMAMPPGLLHQHQLMALTAQQQAALALSQAQMQQQGALLPMAPTAEGAAPPPQVPAPAPLPAPPSGGNAAETPSTGEQPKAGEAPADAGAAAGADQSSTYQQQPQQQQQVLQPSEGAHELAPAGPGEQQAASAQQQAVVAQQQQQQLQPILTVEEWHKHRLEVLMYRLMWVSEAVRSFQDQYSSHSGSRHYELFLRATTWAKHLADDYENQIKHTHTELDKVRAKLLDAACVDLGYGLMQHALEVVRRRIELAARMAREEASLTLLRELEMETAGNGPGQGGSVEGNAGSAGGAGLGAGGAGGKGGGKNASKKAKTSAVDKAREKREKEEAERKAREAEAEARKAAEAAEKARLAEARRAREAAIEAELERRRKELEEIEAAREAEAIRVAKEASLREAAAAAAAAATAASAPATAAVASNGKTPATGNAQSKAGAEPAVVPPVGLTVQTQQQRRNSKRPQLPDSPSPPVHAPAAAAAHVSGPTSPTAAAAGNKVPRQQAQHTAVTSKPTTAAPAAAATTPQPPPPPHRPSPAGAKQHQPQAPAAAKSQAPGRGATVAEVAKGNAGGAAPRMAPAPQGQYLQHLQASTGAQGPAAAWGTAAAIAPANTPSLAQPTAAPQYAARPFHAPPTQQQQSSQPPYTGSTTTHRLGVSAQQQLAPLASPHTPQQPPIVPPGAPIATSTSATVQPAYNPLGENPLLRALLPEATASTSSGGSSADHPTPGFGGPEAGGGASAAGLGAAGGPGALGSSGFTTPLTVSPRTGGLNQGGMPSPHAVSAPASGYHHQGLSSSLSPRAAGGVGMGGLPTLSTAPSAATPSFLDTLSPGPGGSTGANTSSSLLMADPAPDHILSIMSILEPETPGPETSSKSSAAKPSGRAGGAGGQAAAPGRLSTASPPIPSVGGLFGSGVHDASAAAGYGPTASQSPSPSSGLNSFTAGLAQQTPLTSSASSSSLTALHKPGMASGAAGGGGTGGLIPSLGGAAGYSIWSTGSSLSLGGASWGAPAPSAAGGLGAAGGAAGASAATQPPLGQAGVDVRALIGGDAAHSQPRHQQPQSHVAGRHTVAATPHMNGNPGSYAGLQRRVASTLSSAAPPWTGSANSMAGVNKAPQANTNQLSAAELAARLPASLLPASLEPDVLAPSPVRTSSMSGAPSPQPQLHHHQQAAASLAYPGLLHYSNQQQQQQASLGLQHHHQHQMQHGSNSSGSVSSANISPSKLHHPAAARLGASAAAASLYTPGLPLGGGYGSAAVYDPHQQMLAALSAVQQQQQLHSLQGGRAAGYMNAPGGLRQPGSAFDGSSAAGAGGSHWAQQGHGQWGAGGRGAGQH